MPLQNRVDPQGNLQYSDSRGTLMGNRGCLHNEQKEIIRRHQVKRWIYCRLHYKDVRRQVMSPGKYTELFFLDEVTALSAGHRPCGFCLNEKFTHFKRCWNKANGEGEWSLKAIDNLLHQERLQKDYPWVHWLICLPEHSSK